ncbi:SAM-dependent RNA methyltransferase [Desulfonema magnum]|uniref:SAM-dependent RNA methyltransferase n=1 Tax=Desulfonema magnum TaxID=45655 RepID=A0A975BKV2_9BACT|nr:SAM-dependent RNA methyltransferase [Desulfonema magnum]
MTNLDLHDISRAARTYGVKAFYVVTPLDDQKSLAEKIVSHWIRGTGATYNPIRREALELIRIKDSLEDVTEHIRSQGEGEPRTIVTCARTHQGSISYDRFREMLNNGGPCLLIFGTAWGLSEDFISKADYVLDSVRGQTDYNHLSVRSAASIILDRLFRVETRNSKLET